MLALSLGLGNCRCVLVRSEREKIHLQYGRCALIFMGPRSGLRAAPEMAESRIASQVSLRHHAQMLHSHSPQKSITLRGLCPPIV